MAEKVNKAHEEKYLRMTVSERLQHFFLFTSFITLIITGFGLKYPEAFWVKWIVAVVGEDAFEWRGIVHRIAAVVMIAASVYHIYYLVFTKRGHQFFKDMWFAKKDLADVFQTFAYYMNSKAPAPKYARFSYIEKAEYWAVVWGTIVMGLTGAFLWFENLFLPIIGMEGMDISTAIHFYEAILASLAILVWHFYFVFLSPVNFPMNKAWLTGYLTRTQMEHEHPLELEAVDKSKHHEEPEEAEEEAEEGAKQEKPVETMEANAEEKNIIEEEKPEYDEIKKKSEEEQPEQTKDGESLNEQKEESRNIKE